MKLQTTEANLNLWLTSNMKLSSALVASLLLLCVSQAIALVIPNTKTIMDDRILPKEYNPRPKGSETKQTETDEGSDLEYFHVPADKLGNAAADYLVDFKTNEFLRRVDTAGACYLGSLPDKLPKGSDLQTAFSEVFDAHRSPQNQDIVGDYWFVSEKVDKTLLKEEVQNFCDPGFPIYRVRKVELVSTDAEVDGGRTTRRVRRALPLDFTRVSICSPNQIPFRCNPSDWLIDAKIQGRHCIWRTTCRTDSIRKIVNCSVTNWDHHYDSVICLQARCP
ncbi:uncharacterized protein LOC111320911 [Stylophora pistillata]|uniref:uncharacterized protein LOC111320911 n=1 Tax=Stylophora pistillata TaxID=50429 RepID=UPI000C056AAD|nr:uncharacterized protein LOC111320911 [Stylophora pistillata]